MSHVSHTVFQVAIALLSLAILISPIVLANNVDLDRGDPDQPHRR